MSACSPSARTGEATQTSGSASTAASSGKAAADGASGKGAAAARGPSPRLSDPLWVRAKDEDPLERARLAEAVGASGLVEGLEDGGEVAETALAAFPFADDADIALRRLGELALIAEPGALDALVTTIAEIAGKPARAREALDPEGARACGEALVTLAAREGLDRAVRARIVSAARALAEKGYVDPAKITGDLDPAP